VSTIGTAFRETVSRFPDADFLVVPAADGRGYCEEGARYSYADTAREVDALCARYRAAGYGHGHRVALALDNRPEHVMHRLALNLLGISCVPVNPDLRPAEVAYLLGHSEAVLVVMLPHHAATVTAAAREAATGVALWDRGSPAPPDARVPPPLAGEPGQESESSLLYTSGTTGRPKGCILSHGYELACGAWYAGLGGLATFRPGAERVYNPLPLYHVNAGVISLLGMMLTGGCQIQPDRFHPRSWWRDVNETRASVIHYLGVVVPMLLNQPGDPLERAHSVRFGFGAGVEPELHAVFEERFGFPLIEVWGMTEMCRVLATNHEPRRRGTRAMGRPRPGLEVEVRDDDDNPVPSGTVGEMVVRYSARDPRRGAFSGYLKDEAATEHAWRGGWFHTGDSVRQDAEGMLYFVDRRKNIIRRSGENIAAAEVEATLQSHPAVEQVAVVAAPDPLREEEVLACIVRFPGPVPDTALARELFDHCSQRLAYYKCPGWIRFVTSLPKTGSQKIQKHRIFADGADPLAAPDLIDLRAAKRRQASR